MGRYSRLIQPPEKTVFSTATFGNFLTFTTRSETEQSCCHISKMVGNSFIYCFNKNVQVLRYASREIFGNCCLKKEAKQKIYKFQRSSNNHEVKISLKKSIMESRSVNSIALFNCVNMVRGPNQRNEKINN